MPDRRLGRHPSGDTPHLPAFARLAAVAPLPDPPPEIDWGRSVAGWPMLANDVLGDCTIAAILHVLQAVGAYAGYGYERIATDGEAINAYRQLAGYNGTPVTDQGARLSDVMSGWLLDGVSVGGRIDRPAAFVRVDPTNRLHLKQAAALLGPVVVGALLPLNAQTQDVWDVIDSPDATPGGWGGHALVLVAYDDDGVTFITWGALKRATWEWVDKYVDEAWAILHPLWVGSGRAPSGFPTAALLSDMAGIKADGASVEGAA